MKLGRFFLFAFRVQQNAVAVSAPREYAGLFFLGVPEYRAQFFEFLVFEKLALELQALPRTKFVEWATNWASSFPARPSLKPIERRRAR